MKLFEITRDGEKHLFLTESFSKLMEYLSKQIWIEKITRITEADFTEIGGEK